MKSCILPLLFVTLAGWTVPALAQTSGDVTPPPGGSIITSDELRADQVSHTATFSGNVLAVGNNFTLRCQEMVVNFTKDGKVDHITAKGDVVIEQPGRISHCGQAEYFHEDDKFVLTDQPSILDNKNKIEAPKITIYRTSQQMITEGRTKTTLGNGVGTAAAPAKNPQ